MKQIRIGTIGGAGWIGQVHATSMQNVQRIYEEDTGIPVFEIVSDVNEEKLKTVQKKFGYKRYTADWRNLVSDPDVDLVDIATPNSMHYEMARTALENGKHVFCEKPLTLSWEQSEQLSALAQEKGVVNYVAFNNLMNPANQYVKELVQTGKLGKIVRVEGTYDQDMLLDPNIPITWRHINKFAGSGALGDLASHLLSVLQMILGNIREVNGVSSTVIPERPVKTDSCEKARVENEDVIGFMVRYENGAIGTVGASRVATGRKNYFAYEIQGTEGSVVYNLERMCEVNVYFKKDEGRDMGFRNVLLNPYHEGYSAFQPAPGIAIAFNDMKIIEAHTLLSALTRGTDYISNFAFGAKVDAVIAAVLRSVNSRQWEKVYAGK
ncbi:Gfo/Idh/MocA family protein [Pectinatus haikarae]|uniref:Dehydrogenase n=1 Tax=Pectinatus haikarae TaxID=349096 RepID=A0ABT9Y8T7_9FIRM|nr:Gfo/Idh/MocA family oxidoreductase [Pectinatus haikarae]MDQ0204159.1 putative dehydrogenase [Pectinatus haikarae]